MLEVRRYPRSTGTPINEAPFKSLVHEVCCDMGRPDQQMTQSAIDALQQVSEVLVSGPFAGKFFISIDMS